VNLRQVFENYNDRHFIFAYLGGNHGDRLIHTGLKKLADETEISFEDVSIEGFSLDIPLPVKSDTDVIYITPGAYNRVFSGTLQVFKSLYRRYPKNLLIHGPSTVEFRDFKYQDFPPNRENVIFFARERNTFKYMRLKYVQTYLDLDTSFHLTRDSPEFKAFIQGVSIEEGHSLLVYNADYGRHLIPKEIDPGEYDIVSDPTHEQFITWLSIILKASKIVSNRLHTIVLATIAEKSDLTIYSTQFHKNRSMWEYCLKDRGVKWIGPVRAE